MQRVQSGPPPPPPPVIPTSWLAPHEQRWFFVSLFGLLETVKVWDVIAPYFTSPEPTWSSTFRVRNAWTAGGWTALEVAIVAGVALLRIPMLTPSRIQLVQLLILAITWNSACWFVAEPGSLLQSIHITGPPALGYEWWWAGLLWAKQLVGGEPAHITGVHKIRLLPFSTATLNPLSLSYCIPPESQQPLYIPIVFNNSIPEEVSYFIRSLDTGKSEVQTVLGSSLKRSHGATTPLQLTESDEDDEQAEEVSDPLSALILKSDTLDVAKLPSVKPSDSLSLVPPKLTTSQSVLFLTVDRPSVISLKNVVDKRGDRFHITPHKDAVIIECPGGGHFVNEDNGKLIKKPSNQLPAELRCVGDEEVAQFQARGVGALRVGWKKKSKDSTVTGVIEGIEDEVESVDPLALVRRDRISKTHTVPLRLLHDTPGVFTVSLTSVSDSMHNSFTPAGHEAEKVYNVIARPTVRFDVSSPRELLLGKTTALSMQLDGVGSDSLELVYSFNSVEGHESRQTHRVHRKSEQIVVSEPGTYTLLEINGPCNGYVIEPSSVEVELVPLPSLVMTVTTLHECAMDVGSTASFDFTGAPPFVIDYTEQRDNGRAVTRRARFVGHTGEITLQPEHEGRYTYNFVSLSDAKYSSVELNQDAITQTVHPLASAELLGSRQRKLFACSGNSVPVEFETRGSNPLSLTYLVSYNGRSTNTTLHVPPGKQKLMVSVPDELIDKSGGSGRFSIVLISIEDGNGCARKLPSPTVDVEVDRRKPTVRFAKSAKIVMTEGESTRAALRLTGSAPWELVYSINGAERKVTMRDPNNHLTFEQKGTYELKSIKDAHCSGEVLKTEATYEVDFRPRPQVHVQPVDELREERGVFRHKGLCAGEEDQVALRFSGQPPFELGYRYTTSGKTSRHTLKSAQETGILHLDTIPGVHRYDLIDLKDSNYAKNPVSIAIEHEVYTRPAVTFSKQNHKPLCLDTSLSGDARIKLEGKAPFTVDLSVRKPAGSKVESFTITSKSHEWTLDLPYTVKEVGRHEVSITGVKDSSGCDWDIRDGDVLTTTVEVVESARIVPVSQTVDLCAGDTLDFLLQGKSPWIVEYEWLGKKHAVTSSASRFSRKAERDGEFTVRSVALKDNQCKREILDMKRIIHPLPSVKIQEGLQSLREGDDPAAFSVKLVGTPPFSFTYTRSEIVGSKSKIVETQTVTDVMEEIYTISSSAPGDYQVVSVSDKYCRYPPLSKGREIV